MHFIHAFDRLIFAIWILRIGSNQTNFCSIVIIGRKSKPVFRKNNIPESNLDIFCFRRIRQKSQNREIRF